MSLLRTAKVAAFEVASRAGVFDVVARSGWRNRRLLILAYHGCALDDEHRWNQSLYMTQEQLRSRFETIRRLGCHVLPLGEAVRRLKEGTLPTMAVAITVDDGAYDFAARIVPLLDEFQYPATVYVSTYYTRKGVPVFDTMLRYLAWKAPAAIVSGAGLADRETLDLTSQVARDRTARAIAQSAADRGLGGEEKDELLRLFAERIGVDYADLVRRRLLQLMGPADFAALPRDLVSVQLHTHRHRVPVEREAFIREIDDNRRALGELGLPVAGLVDFCYPSGVTHPLFPDWLESCGVRTATTCHVALASADDSPLLLPRFVDTGRCLSVEFEGWLTGAAQFTPHRRQAAPAAPAAW